MRDIFLALLLYLSHKAVVFCGHCGAVEYYVSDGKTTCPDCDVTGMEKSNHHGKKIALVQT